MYFTTDFKSTKFTNYHKDQVVGVKEIEPRMNLTNRISDSSVDWNYYTITSYNILRLSVKLSLVYYTSCMVYHLLSFPIILISILSVLSLTITSSRLNQPLTGELVAHFITSVILTGTTFYRRTRSMVTSLKSIDISRTYHLIVRNKRSGTPSKDLEFIQSERLRRLAIETFATQRLQSGPLSHWLYETGLCDSDSQLNFQPNFTVDFHLRHLLGISFQVRARPPHPTPVLTLRVRAQVRPHYSLGDPRYFQLLSLVLVDEVTWDECIVL